MTLNITVVRHGNTDANNEGWIQGQYDTVLNQNGLNQARNCGERLKDQVYDHVYCSDLTRCKQTLNAILAHHQNVDIEYLTALRERGFGTLERMSIKTMYSNASSRKLNVDLHVHEHGGETSNVFKQRVYTVWEYIVKDATEKHYENVLVVSHGGVIRNFSYYWAAFGYKPVTEQVVVVPSTLHGNTAVSVVDAASKLIYEFNSTTHLEDHPTMQPPPAV